MTATDSDELPSERPQRQSAFRIKRELPSAARERAASSVAERFTRLMRATASPYGELTDPTLVAAAMGVTVFAGLTFRAATGMPPNVGSVFLASVLPLSLGLAFNWPLRSSRERVVAWLAGLPFSVGNLNGLLNGIATVLRVRFVETVPRREALNDLLEPIHPDCFALEFDEAEPIVEILIGVPSSKWNPARSNHLRYERVRQILERAVVQIACEHPVVEVWIA